MSMFKDVKEFQEQVLGNKAAEPPSALSRDDAVSLCACVFEETIEFIDGHRKGDLAEVADAVADAIYFLLGYAYRAGIPFDEVWALVHAANMKKHRGMTKRGVEGDAAKPEGWVDPVIAIREILCRRDH